MRNFLLVFFLGIFLISLAPALPSPTQYQTDGEWELTKHDGIQQQYFDITEEILSNTKTKICLIPKVDTTTKDSWYKDNKAELKQQASSVSSSKIQPNDWEKETEKGNIKKMCIDIDSKTETYVKIGSSSIVYEWIEGETWLIYDTDTYDKGGFYIEAWEGEEKLTQPEIVWIVKDGTEKFFFNQTNQSNWTFPLTI